MVAMRAWIRSPAVTTASRQLWELGGTRSRFFVSHHYCVLLNTVRVLLAITFKVRDVVDSHFVGFDRTVSHCRTGRRWSLPLLPSPIIPSSSPVLFPELSLFFKTIKRSIIIIRRHRFGEDQQLRGYLWPQLVALGFLLFFFRIPNKTSSKLFVPEHFFLHFHFGRKKDHSLFSNLYFVFIHSQSSRPFLSHTKFVF